jgi:LemA protein
MVGVLVALGILLGLLLLVTIFVTSMYNQLVTLRNRFKNAFAQIDVQLKRRYDLIPNLVETAKGYLSHERETLEAVIQARANAMNAEKRAAASPGDPAAMQGLLGAEQVLTGALGRLFALSEAYPDLKADRTMQQLSEELTSTENRIAFARQSFNDAVMAFNTRLETFPANVIGGMFNFQSAAFLEAVTDAQEREAPRVSF